MSRKKAMLTAVRQFLRLRHWRTPEFLYAHWQPGSQTPCQACNQLTGTLYAVPAENDGLEALCRACAAQAM